MLSSHPKQIGGRLLLTTSVASVSTFSTNCTLPTETTTHVSDANLRGTFDILWGNLFTIVICIWAVQHLNLPEQRNGRDQGWRGDLKWAWKSFFTKFRWMAFTLILPEFLGAKAYAEMRLARRLMDKVKSFKAVDGESLSEEEISNWTKTHAYYAEMGCFVIRPYGASNMDARVVATADILELRRNSLLPTLPRITAEHLSNLSNGDPLTKAAAIGQVSWMVVQIKARAVKRLPSTVQNWRSPLVHLQP
jgi:hypothetical protein